MSSIKKDILRHREVIIVIILFLYRDKKPKYKKKIYFEITGPIGTKFVHTHPCGISLRNVSDDPTAD